jgi:hypothetical protein
MMTNEMKFFRAAPLDFLRHHSVSPESNHGRGTDNNLGGYDKSSGTEHIKTIETHSLYSGNQGKKKNGGVYYDTLLTISKNADKIAYGKLSSINGDARNYALRFYAANQLMPENMPDYLPMWLLPWQADHVTELKIPAADANTRDPGPSLFFTSALSGCSVFVKGTRKSPTILHAGTENRNFDQFAKLNPDSAVHWRMLFDKFYPNAQRVGEVKGSDYLVLPDDNPLIVKAKAKLEKQGNIRIENVVTQGTVFGIRDDQFNWKFYLQQKANVQYITFTVKRKIFGKDKMIQSTVQNINRPLCLIEIFPNGSNQSMLWNKEPIFV